MNISLLGLILFLSAGGILGMAGILIAVLIYRQEQEERQRKANETRNYYAGYVPQKVGKRATRGYVPRGRRGAA